jgi:proteasome lid subunit RPN8/RPN11
MLRFSPTAWAKLLFMRDLTDNEVAGFGVTDADDLLFVNEFVVIKQQVTCVSFIFDDQAVADFFEEQVDLSRKPEQFARIWLHSHPGNSPEPSVTDEETFARVFGNCYWSIMCIVARNGNTFARLRFNVGPGGEVKIPVCVDYSYEFEAADFELWKQQYKANVSEDNILKQTDKSNQPAGCQEKNIEPFGNQNFGRVPLLSSDDLLSEIDQMDPMERQFFMDELAVRSDFWDEESEVSYE